MIAAQSRVAEFRAVAEKRVVGTEPVVGIVDAADGIVARIVRAVDIVVAVRRHASAEGESARFDQVLKEYRKAPRVMRDRMYIDAMEEVLSNTTKVIIDQKANSNLLFLPLDKLIQSAAGVAATGRVGGDNDGSASTPTTNENRRTREAFRSRTRESR